MEINPTSQTTESQCMEGTGVLTICRAKGQIPGRKEFLQPIRFQPSLLHMLCALWCMSAICGFGADHAEIIVKAKTGVKVLRPYVGQVSWEGGEDAKGFAEGPGVLSVFTRTGKIAAVFRGTMRAGRLGGEVEAMYPNSNERAGYRGQFSDWSENGRGTMTLRNGERVEGIWRDGELVMTLDTPSLPRAESDPVVPTVQDIPAIPKVAREIERETPAVADVLLTQEWRVESTELSEDDQSFEVHLIRDARPSEPGLMPDTASHASFILRGKKGLVLYGSRDAQFGKRFRELLVFDASSKTQLSELGAMLAEYRAFVGPMTPRNSAYLKGTGPGLMATTVFHGPSGDCNFKFGVTVGGMGKHARVIGTITPIPVIRSVPRGPSIIYPEALGFGIARISNFQKLFSEALAEREQNRVEQNQRQEKMKQEQTAVAEMQMQEQIASARIASEDKVRQFQIEQEVETRRAKAQKELATIQANEMEQKERIAEVHSRQPVSQRATSRVASDESDSDTSIFSDLLEKLRGLFGYFGLYIGIAIWLFFDAKKRHFNGLPWAAFTAILGPLVVPFYFAKRPLKEGEVREGGFAWNVLKCFALFWTITMAVGFFAGMTNASEHAGQYTSNLERAGAGIGMAIGGALIFFLWFFVLAGALVLGFFLKKSTVIERGPTGPLAIKV